MKKPLLLLFGCLFFMISCEVEPAPEEFEMGQDLKIVKNNLKGTPVFHPKPPLEEPTEDEDLLFDENLRSIFLPNDEEIACLPTDLAFVLLKYLDKIVTDPVAEEYYNTYLLLNRNLAQIDASEQYFGKDGEYTKFVEKQIRQLERFWDMEGELRVNGQHSNTLNDREKLAAHYYNMLMDDASWEEAYMRADLLIALNEQSPNLPESPLFSSDGFTNTRNMIVIGDGLIQILSETGIDPKIVWTGTLAHEWTHQIQIDHAEEWYNGTASDLGRPLHVIEMEADFFAAYYMTHKRGATYNWKKVELFLDLFFQVGACDIGSPSHHGTPAQRMLASEYGYQLAHSAQKKGHILTPDEVHAAFELILPELL